MVENGNKNVLNQTKGAVLGLISDYIERSETEVVPVTSCHSAVAYWIYSEDAVNDSDEIVLLGPDVNNDLVYHSILMRGDDIIGDTERASDSRNIDTKYDGKTGVYTTKMDDNSASDFRYETLHRISIKDFKDQYLRNANHDAGVEPSTPDVL